jgi:tetratricopeptide (TPR) repeat protein
MADHSCDKGVLMPFALILVMLIALGGALSVPSFAQQQRGPSAPVSPEREYQRCNQLVDQDASAAFEFANGWVQRGGGDPARHCVAMALMRLQRYGDAAQTLERLADGMAARNSSLRAEALQQAAQAWLLADQLERANATLTAALRLAPDAVDLMVDRATVLGLAKNYGAAIEDLNRALQRAPTRVDALVLRAVARRFLDQREAALADVEAALKLDPRNIDALLERGLQRRLAEDKAGARADWMAVLSIGPETAQGDDARLNLERLDVKSP